MKWLYIKELRLTAGFAAAVISVPSVAGGTLNSAMSRADSSVAVSDTLRGRLLKDVNVSGKRVRSHIMSVPGMSIIGMELLDDMPRILGNADPVHYAQLLPGVQTNSEYDAGIHIQGCDNSHNYVSVGGVPLYGVAHLLGFFSVFNGSHFSGMSIRKSPVAASAPNRLGGMVDMLPAYNDIAPSGSGSSGGGNAGMLHGDVALGPMSSQATLHIPTGNRSQIVLSARESYVNLLYSGLLKMDDDKLKYGFGDYNMSFNTQISRRSTLSIEGYWGHDNASVISGGSTMDTRLKWNNYMASVRLGSIFGNSTVSHCVYFTGYDNDFVLNHANFDVALISGITDIGYRSDFSVKGLKAGIELVRHGMQPQKPSVSGVIGSEMPRVEFQHSFESVLYASYVLPLPDGLTAEAGVRFTSYRKFGGGQDGGGNTFWSVDPGLTVAWVSGSNSSYSLNAGIRHQYLFQTGFSSIGLPTEYWFSAGGRYRPQYSFNISAASENYFSGKHYRLSAELYYKRLFHQIENIGNVFDLIFSTYSPDASVILGNGCNYGLNMLLEKRKGQLTGWVSYSLGRAWRRYPGTVYSGRYPASHERIHELNIVGTCRIGRRWSIGGMFVAASGTPYTKVEQFYLVSGNILSSYGPHNGSRLNPYMRLDLSVCYDFAVGRGRRSGINLSLYNVTMHDNDLFYRLKVTKGNTVVYTPLRFIMPILPSINYYYKF